MKSLRVIALRTAAICVLAAFVLGLAAAATGIFLAVQHSDACAAGRLSC